MTVRALAATLALALLAAAGCDSAAVTNSQKSVEERLTCQCGCGLTVHTCNHLQCNFGVPVKEDIAKSLAAGATAQEILDRYMSQYGEKILSSPIPRGFNLLAWFGPYVALFTAAAIVVLVIRRWRVSPASSSASAASISPEERRRLDDELDDVDS